MTSFFNGPKAASVSTTTTAKVNGTTVTTAATQAVVEAPGPKFDKKKWVEKLTAEQKGLLQLEIDTLDESWLAQLKDEVTSKEFLELKRFLKKEVDSGKKIFPPLADVYSW